MAVKVQVEVLPYRYTASGPRKPRHEDAQLWTRLGDEGILTYKTLVISHNLISDQS
jgi:hypothetical protein